MPPATVNQAFSDALHRARQQWSFNLLIAFVTAGLIILGTILTVIWLANGQGAPYSILIGPGAALLGVGSWVITRPAAQLSRADTQISLLALVWANYAQELRSCAALRDPAATATCTAQAGADAVRYFNEILGALPPPPDPAKDR